MKQRDIEVLLEDIDDKLKAGLEYGSMIPEIRDQLKQVEKRLASVEQRVTGVEHDTVRLPRIESLLEDQTSQLRDHDENLTRLEGTR